MPEEYPDLIEDTAIHEAAHAVIGTRLAFQVKTVVVHQYHSGLCHFRPSDDPAAEDVVCILLAARIAERELCHVYSVDDTRELLAGEHDIVLDNSDACKVAFAVQDQRLDLDALEAETVALVRSHEPEIRRVAGLLLKQPGYEWTAEELGLA